MKSLFRSIRAEAIRCGGTRGSLLSASLPLGLFLPKLVTLIIGKAAETIHSANGLFQVREVATSNSIYWIIYLGVTIHCVVATYAQSSVNRGDLGEYNHYIFPSSTAELLGRWIVNGAIGAICSFFATIMMLVALPAFFPNVYGQVAAASPEGIRFLWAVPAYCFSAVCIGIGVGAVIRLPAAAVTLVTLWSLFIESAMTYVPKGAFIIKWMPFLNGVYGTGQQIALEPSWDKNFALFYVFIIAVLLVIAGIIVTHYRRRK